MNGAGFQKDSVNSYRLWAVRENREGLVFCTRISMSPTLLTFSLPPVGGEKKENVAVNCRKILNFPHFRSFLHAVKPPVGQVHRYPHLTRATVISFFSLSCPGYSG